MTARIFYCVLPFTCVAGIAFGWVYTAEKTIPVAVQSARGVYVGGQPQLEVTLAPFSPPAEMLDNGTIELVVAKSREMSRLCTFENAEILEFVDGAGVPVTGEELATEKGQEKDHQRAIFYFLDPNKEYQVKLRFAPKLPAGDDGQDSENTIVEALLILIKSPGQTDLATSLAPFKP